MSYNSKWHWWRVVTSTLLTLVVLPGLYKWAAETARAAGAASAP